MNREELKRLVALGEDSGRQFKADIRNPDSLASDLVAFSNGAGGVVLIGVADDGSLPGLDSEDVHRVNQLIANAATQHMRSPISPSTENVAVGEGRVVIVLTIPDGLDRPYFDRQGVIWVKAGSDKRRIQSKEELRRLFQSVDLLHADEVPTKADVAAIDRLRFREFVRENYNHELPEAASELSKLLGNLNLAEDGKLILAGLLLFGERPQRFKPAFTLKAVHYPGTEISAADYLDSEDYEGPLSSIFEGAMAFLRRVLPKQAAKGGVNAQARWPVPQIVFEELLVNALTHRDYFIEAPIRLFVFDDRVELVSPGSLPNHLTVEKIQAGVSVIRNPIIASFVAKGLLPYRGLGTGVRRAVSEWAAIEFKDNRDACTFTAKVSLIKGHSEPISESINQKNASKVLHNEPLGVLRDSNGEPIKGVQTQVLSILRIQSGLSYDELANELHIGRSTVMRHLRDLKKRGVLHRVGSKKSGRWEILIKPVGE